MTRRLHFAVRIGQVVAADAHLHHDHGFCATFPPQLATCSGEHRQRRGLRQAAYEADDIGAKPHSLNVFEFETVRLETVGSFNKANADVSASVRSLMLTFRIRILFLSR